jgi:TP901 family phage tail tape measure protein
MAGGTAEIGIRVYLDDAASAGLSSVSSSLSRLGHEANSASSAFGLMSGRMAQFGIIAGVAASFALFAGALKFSYDQAQQLQQSLFGIAIATHEPMTAAQGYATVLMNLAATSTYTTSQLADGVALLGRSGYSLHDIFTQVRSGTMTMAEAGRDLGIAIRTDSVSAFGLLAQTMRAYNLPAAEAEHTANLLQFAFERQRGSVSDFRSGLAQVTPDAARFGVSMREVMAALDVVSPQMNTTARAGTALRYMIDGLYTPTDKAKNEMKALGLGAFDASGNFHSLFYNAQGKAVDFATAVQILNNHLKGLNQEARDAALKDLFSTKGGQGVKALLGDIPHFLALLKQLNQNADNSGGVFKRWQEQMNTAAGAIGGLKSSITDLGAVIGTYLLPFVTRAAQTLNDFVTRIRGIAAANPQAVAQFLLLGAALAGVATVVILLMTPIGALVGEIILVAAGAMLLVAGIMIAVNWFRNLYNSSALLRSIIGNLGALFNTLGEAVRTSIAQAFSTVQQVFEQTHFKAQDLQMALYFLAAVVGVVAAVLIGVLVGALRGVIVGLAMFIAGLAMVLAGLGQFVSGVVQFFVGLFTIIQGLVTGNTHLITVGWNDMKTGVLNIIRGLVLAIIGLFIGVFGTIIGFIVGFVQGIISWFQALSNILVGHSIIPDMINAIRNAFVNGFNAVISFIAGAVGRIISFFSNLASRIGTLFTIAWNAARTATAAAFSFIASAVSSGVSSLLSRLGAFGVSARNTMTSAWNAIRNAVSSAVGFIGGIINSFAARASAILSGAWNGIRNAASAAWNFIRSVISSAASWISGRISALGSSIGSAMSSAWNFIRGVVAGGVAGVIGFINSMAAQVSARFNMAWNYAKMIVMAAIVYIQAYVGAGMANVIGRISAAGEGIRNTMQNAWNSARNAASSGINTIVSLASGLPGRVVGAISKLAGMLYTSGLHAMQSFADGLRSALGAVVDAVATAAGKVASFLGHSAPPKIGPLSNDDQWMPHMMQTLAKGIEDSAPLLQSAANKAAGNIASIPQMARMGAPTVGVGGGGGGQGGSKVVQLVVDGRVLGQAVMNDFTTQLQLNGGGRSFR